MAFIYFGLLYKYSKKYKKALPDRYFIIPLVSVLLLASSFTFLELTKPKSYHVVEDIEQVVEKPTITVPSYVVAPLDNGEYILYSDLKHSDSLNIDEITFSFTDSPENITDYGSIVNVQIKHYTDGLVVGIEPQVIDYFLYVDNNGFSNYLSLGEEVTVRLQRVGVSNDHLEELYFYNYDLLLDYILKDAFLVYQEFYG